MSSKDKCPSILPLGVTGGTTKVAAAGGARSPCAALTAVARATDFQHRTGAAVWDPDESNSSSRVGDSCIFIYHISDQCLVAEPNRTQLKRSECGSLFSDSKQKLESPLHHRMYAFSGAAGKLRIFMKQPVTPAMSYPTRFLSVQITPP